MTSWSSVAARGLAAAVAAAGGGARTALVERYGFLGGMATAGMVSTICGLYRTSSVRTSRAAQPGVRRDVRPAPDGDARLRGAGAPGRTHVLPYTPFAFACLADEVAAEAPGLDVYLHAYLVRVGRAGEPHHSAAHLHLGANAGAEGARRRGHDRRCRRGPPGRSGHRDGAGGRAAAVVSSCSSCRTWTPMPSAPAHAWRWRARW